MNNQFFGDERDVYKYALLRALARDGLRIGVCWLLTEGCRNGGGVTAYLRDENSCQARTDRKLFNFLQHWVCRKQKRDVRLMENAGENIIPKAKYFRDVFPEDDRGDYFAKMTKRFADCDLVFFDPDKGMFPRTKTRNPFDEYIQFGELAECWQQIPHASFMVFQYFYLEFTYHQTQKQHAGILKQLKKATSSDAEICVIWRKPVAYYFLIRKQNCALLKKITEAANKCGFKVVTP